MKITKLTYVIAIVLALLAGGAVYVYQSTADARALAGKQAVNVVVAKADLAVGIRLGDAVAQGLVGFEAYPAAAIPAGALTSVDQSNSSLLVNHAIGNGQLVLSTELSATANPNAQILVPTGRVALTVNVDDASRVANFVVPGSRVVVYWTPTDPTQSRVLLPVADVIAVGATSTASANQTQNGNNGLVTFAVTPADAPRVVLATKTGSVYLGLLGDKTDISAGSIASADSLRSK